MKLRSSNAFLFCAASLSLLLFVSCGTVIPLVTEIPVFTATFTPAYGLTLWAETLTALSGTETAVATATGETPVVTPSFTPSAGATVVSVPGDLGWGAVHGVIVDGVTHLPIDGATIKCEHSSYTSPSLCKGIIMTNADGIYSFVPVFFHDTDRITLLVEAPGYTPLHFERSFFAQPDFRGDLELFPATGDTSTPTPFLMCTPPVCSGGALTCGNSNGCLGGCGTICLTPTP